MVGTGVPFATTVHAGKWDLMQFASLCRAVALPLLVLVVAACGTTQAVPPRSSAVVSPAPSAAPKTPTYPTPTPGWIVDAMADQAGMASWVDENNHAERRVAAALADVVTAFDGKSWSEREAAVLAWGNALEDVPDGSDGYGNPGCWGQLASTYDHFYAEQIDISEKLGFEIENHYAEYPIVTLNPVGGEPTPRQALRNLARDYDRTLAGALSAGDVAALCDLRDVTAAPAVPAPGESSIVDGVRIGAPSLVGEFIVARLENTTAVDQMVPAHGTVVAGYRTGTLSSPPKGWKQIGIGDAEVAPQPENAHKSALSGQRALRTSLGMVASVSVTNTT